MLIEATAMEVRKNFGELINQVQYRNAFVEITKSSKPVAAIINIETLDKIKFMEKAFDVLSKKIRSSFKNEDLKKTESVIEEAILKIRKNKTKK